MSQDQVLFGAPAVPPHRMSIEWFRPHPKQGVTLRMVGETPSRNKPMTLIVHLSPEQSVSAALGFLNASWMCSWYVGWPTLQQHFRSVLKRLQQEGYDCDLIGAGGKRISA